MLVLRTAVILTVKLAALLGFQAVSVIRYAISLMIVVLILLKSVHVSKTIRYFYIQYF